MIMRLPFNFSRRCAKQIAIILLTYAGAVTAQTKDYPIKPLSFTNVALSDRFWLPKIETNRVVTIPTSFARCESTGRVENFELAATHKGKFCTKYPFDDTDIYKTIEGASYSMAVHPDKKLDAYIDSLIVIISKAQEPDGYLYTARTIDPLHPHPWSGSERWVQENVLSHELYDSGHLFEAATAHFLATGKRNLLNIALKNANLLVATFGPNKRHVAPGHEIVEMGLVSLYRITKEQKYLDLAKFFIEQRGIRSYDKTSPDEWKNGMYWQDDQPVLSQEEAEGHAVRAMYLYSAMADIAALTGDKKYTTAIDRIWNNMVGKKMYVQGGIGAVPDGERFGADYELPNVSAYNETCAAVGQAFWDERMFLLHGDARYIDVLEKVLYNGLISGVGLDGKSFFYSNAMEVTNGITTSSLETTRSGWFECSCCPTNLARFLPSLPGYIYAQNKDELYVNLFIASTANLNLNGRPIQLTQVNNYPWDGALSINLNPEKPSEFKLLIRIPGWSRGEAIPLNLYRFEKPVSEPVKIYVNNHLVSYHLQKGYAVINRLWKKGDKVTLQLPMDVNKVVANPNILSDQNKVALQRGPLIYSAEWVDNGGKVSNIQIPKSKSFKSNFNPKLLNGVTVIQGSALQPDSLKAAGKNVVLTAIPYYAWANRGKGEMRVWFLEKFNPVKK